MRVLLVSQEVPPETAWGGIGTYVDVLAPALSTAGADVTVLSVVRGQPHGETQRDGVRVLRRPLVRPPGVGMAIRLPEAWERLTLAAGIMREVDRLPAFSIVEAPEWRAEALGIALRRTIPLVIRLHSGAADITAQLGWSAADRRLSVRLEDAAVLRAQVVVSTRSHLRSAAARLGLARGALAAIPTPVAERDAVGPAAGPPRILFVGRLEQRKNPEVLIEAAPEVLRRVPEARFVFAGRGGDPADASTYAGRLLARARRLGIEHAVELLGQVPRDEVFRQIARASACAFPSRWETFGLVAGEAASVGRPIIASAISGFSEYLSDGESAWLVHPDDVEGWARALVAAITMPAEARERAAAARAAVRDRCSPDVVAAQTIDAYELALARWSSSPTAGAKASVGA